RTIAGRYSDSRAWGARFAPRLLDAASQAVAQCNGIVRSQSPLRGSSGFAPDSRLSPDNQMLCRTPLTNTRYGLEAALVNRAPQCGTGAQFACTQAAGWVKIGLYWYSLITFWIPFVLSLSKHG